MKTVRLPIALAIAAIPFSIHAQESGLATVVVTAPTAVDQTFSSPHLDHSTLAPLRAATSDTASLVRDVPGVTLYGAGGVSSLPAIHGLADDRVRVKLDGMDLVASCPNHMNPALSYVDPSNVAGIDVYAGIAPVSVTGDSIGGAIVVETAEPEFAGPGQSRVAKGEVGAFYRSNGNANGANLSAIFATESFNLSYSGATAKSDNYRAGGDFKTLVATGRPGHNLPLDEVGSTAYETRNQTLGLALRSGEHLLEARFGVQDLPYQLYPNQRMDMLKNSQDRVNLRYLGKLDWGKLEARVYREKVDHYMDFGADKQFVYGAAPGVVAPGMPMYTRGKTTGASAKAEIELSTRDLLRVGGDYQSYRLDDWWPPSPADLTGMLDSMGHQATTGGMAPDTFWNIRDGKRDRLGVFAEWEAHLSPQWRTQVGIRTEQVKADAGSVQGYNGMMAGYAVSAAAFNAREHKRTDSNLDLTALARYSPDASRTFEFGVAQKTRSPNLYERYSWSQNGMALEMNNFVGDGNGYLGNPDLKPEVAHTVSATGDWHAADRRWEFKATPYYTRVTDYIDAIRCPGSGTMMNALCGGAANNTASNKYVNMQYANQSARIFGLDLSGRVPLTANSWGEFGLKGVLSYTNGKNLDTGSGLYNIVPVNAKLSLTHRLGGWSNALELVVVDAKDKVSDARNEIKTPSYQLANLRASYSWQRVRVDFGVENLFDKLYYLPTGGAYTGQGMTMSANGIPWGIAVPGMGRSFYTAVSLQF